MKYDENCIYIFEDLMKIPLLVLGDFAWDVIISTDNHLPPGSDVMSAGELAVCVSSWVVSKFGARPQTDDRLTKRIKEYKLQSV